MVYKVYQKVSHPQTKYVYEKTITISGRDLKHAVELIRGTPQLRRDLLKKYWAEQIEPNGRRLYIEIKEEK